MLTIRRRAVASALLLCSVLACDPFPRDPNDTLQRVHGGTLRVGATESPPWLLRAGEGAEGEEAAVIESFARSIGARVEWDWGPVDDHMEQLEKYELDIVAAGFTRKSPWGRHGGLSRAYARDGRRRRVLAVPPGENAFLVALERHIRERHDGKAP